MVDEKIRYLSILFHGCFHPNDAKYSHRTASFVGVIAGHTAPEEEKLERSMHFGRAIKLSKNEKVRAMMIMKLYAANVNFRITT